MFTATHEVNTHQGAIFSLGLFVCASAYCQNHTADEFTVIQKMTQGLVEHDLGQKKVRQQEKSNFCNMVKVA